LLLNYPAFTGVFTLILIRKDEKCLFLIVFSFLKASNFSSPAATLSPTPPHPGSSQINMTENDDHE